MTDWHARIADLVDENFAAEVAFLRELARLPTDTPVGDNAAQRNIRPSCSKPWVIRPNGMPCPPPCGERSSCISPTMKNTAPPDPPSTSA